MPEGANYTIWVGLNKVNEDLSGDYYWSIGWEDHDVSKPDYWLKNASKAAKYDHVMKMTESLEPKFREIFQLTSVDRIIPRQTVYQYGEISCLPGGRYVVVGDAAHPMTPCKSPSRSTSLLKPLIHHALQSEEKEECMQSETRFI
jgi:hypothetical protein